MRFLEVFFSVKFSANKACNSVKKKICAVLSSVVCGNWFFHLTGLYTFALSAVYGITLYTLSDYSDNAFLDAIVDTKSATATVYPWQIR